MTALFHDRRDGIPFARARRVPIILCSPTLWRFVRAWRSASAAPIRGQPSGVLGPWAATAILRGRREIVVSVEQRTYMTIVCELGAEATFPAAWRQALLTAFDDMNVPAERISGESAAALRLAPLANERLTAVLATIEFVCEIDLHYGSDLRRVQQGLNEFPHDHPPDYAPINAVRRLFGVRA